VRSRRHHIAITLATGLLISACGSSGKPSGAASSGDPLKFAQCMRAHGVPNFPDPSPNGGGIQIQAGSGVKPFSPAFMSAQSHCRSLLPGGGPPSGHASAQAKAEMLKTSECMRAHGISGFPDPTTSPPSNPGDFSVAMGRGGAFLAVPKTIDIQSPAFQQAAAACGFGPRRTVTK
jgi:hypothetical protein